MVNKKYQILQLSLKQQLLVLLPFLNSSAILFFGGAVIFHGEAITGIVLGAYLLTFVLFVLPVLVLHIQYLAANYGLILIIHSEAKEIEVRRGAIIEKYSFDAIESLDYYATAGHISKKGASPAFYSFDSYRFYKLKLCNNKKYYLTCLLINDIEHKLENLIGIEADWHFRAVPLLY